MDIKVPESALKIYAEVDVLRNYNVKLDQIVFMYNSLVNQLNDVERPLLEKKIVKMDSSLKAGINDFKWQAPKITEEFINPT